MPVYINNFTRVCGRYMGTTLAINQQECLSKTDALVLDFLRDAQHTVYIIYIHIYGDFLKRVPPNHPFTDGLSILKPSMFTSILGNPHIFPSRLNKFRGCSPGLLAAQRFNFLVPRWCQKVIFIMSMGISGS